MGGRGGALKTRETGTSFHDMSEDEKKKLMVAQWKAEMEAEGYEDDIADIAAEVFAKKAGDGYVADGESYDINDALRTDGRLNEWQRDVVARMDAATNKELGADINLIRNVGGRSYIPEVFDGIKRDALLRMSDAELANFSKQHQGKIVTERAYMSTSYNVKQNIFRDRPVQMRIRAPKNAKGFITNNYLESEVVLRRGTQYVINKVSAVTRGGFRKLVIDVTIIP